MPQVSEELERLRAKPLPKGTFIDSFSNAPPGWIVYYHQADAKRVIALPISVWALVEYERDPDHTPVLDDDTDMMQEIRHFVVTNSGAVVDYLDIPGDFLCVVGPMIKDHVAVVRTHLIERGLELEGMAFAQTN